jgi:nucleoside-diphosphate-sugar epimerase
MSERSPSRAVAVLVRVIPDVLMLNAALMLGLAIRWLWLVVVQDGVTITRASTGYIAPSEALGHQVQAYLRSFPFLTAICLVVFALSGFYTRGRAYRGRYKALVILQAVSLSYVLFGAFTFLLGGFIDISRSGLVISWAITVGLLVCARLWTVVWRVASAAEKQLLRLPEERRVERVLVIGGAGYIGSALLPKLLELGYRVRLLDSMVYGTEPISAVVDHPNLEVVNADFRQVDKVTESMRDVDAVIHLGAIVGDPACALDEQLTIDVNVMATRMIAEVAKGMGVNRFVFASTCSVYGASSETLDERSALRPVSLYARSKIASEFVLQSLATAHFAPVILRFATIYGLSGRTRFDLVVNLLTAKAYLEREIMVFGGDQWRPFVHVSDAASAVVRAVQAPLALVRNQVFNVGSDRQNYTIAQVAELVRSLVPGTSVRVEETDVDRRDYRVSFAKIRRTLSFEPERRVENGVREVIQAFESGRVADYRNPKYSNEKFLTEHGIDLFKQRHAPSWARDLVYRSWADDDAEAVVGEVGEAEKVAATSA